jgi:hypothetical protein
MNKTQEKPLPEEMKLSEFMKIPTREEHFKQLYELGVKECDNENIKELTIEKEMEPCRIGIEKGHGSYIYGYSYEEPRDQDIVPPRLQDTEDKVWIPTLKLRMGIVKIIKD